MEKIEAPPTFVDGNWNVVRFIFAEDLRERRLLGELGQVFVTGVHGVLLPLVVGGLEQVGVVVQQWLPLSVGFVRLHDVDDACAPCRVHLVLDEDGPSHHLFVPEVEKINRK